VRGNVHAFRDGATCRPDPKRRQVAALQGKPPILILGAIMNKLLHLAYGVLKTQKPFDPEYLKNMKKNA
jgi:hypothetical protein